MDREQVRRIGVCFNDYEPFYWGADKDDQLTCPACSQDDEDYAEIHGFFVRESALEQAERDNALLARAVDDLIPSPDGGYGPNNGAAWKDAYLDRMREKVQAERDLEGVHLALAEADVPRSDGVDEPLYSEQHRVRLLRERAEQAERERDEANEAARTQDSRFRREERERIRAEARLAAVPALVEALRKLADAEAYSMRDEDHARYGFAHGPWYFDPETDDGDEAPWQIAQGALAAYQESSK